MKIGQVEEIMEKAWACGIEIPYMKMPLNKNIDNREFYDSLENISVFKYHSDFGPVVIEVIDSPVA